MSEQTCVEFGKKWLNIYAEKVNGGKVLEVSLQDSILRAITKKMNPHSYIEVGVDEIISIYDLTKHFGSNNFDVVICVGMLEHIRDWKKAIREISNILNIEGLVILTTHSPEFEKQSEFDYWRFTSNDLYDMFQGFSIQEITNGSEHEVLFAGIKKEIWLADISGLHVFEVE
jgi:SAM-dependent methyltransferase